MNQNKETLIVHDDTSVDVEEEEEESTEVIEDIKINYKAYILDLSLSFKRRISLIKKYYIENKDNTIEIISRIAGMYQFSGTQILQKYLNGIALESDISSFIKVEAVKGLLSFSEFEEDICDKDDKEMKEIKILSNMQIQERNKKRQDIAYNTFNIVCSSLDNELSTPYKIEIITMLMENEKYNHNASEYFIKVINNDNIDCDYRYKAILSLENKNKIFDLSYQLQNSLSSFLSNEKNALLYRILAAQYLLRLKIENYRDVENVLLSIAENEENEYNLRADASDVLLSLGSEEMKVRGREIIIKLGGKGKTIFENKQNVHVKEIEKSILNILEKLCSVSNIEIEKGKLIDFEYVESKIKENVKENNLIDVSLNRIKIDRTLYSTYGYTLSKVLIKLWTYIQHNENKEEMEKRLLNELEEMAGTCSSGFLGRLVNSVSGFGDMNLSISFEDQIVSNFGARLNAYARNIAVDFRNEPYLSDIKKLLKFEEGKDDLDELLNNFYDSVIDEMMLSCSDYKNRPSFLLFFRTYMSRIREEMFKEFIEYITETDFDLYFRKALSHYDGIRDMV